MKLVGEQLIELETSFQFSEFPSTVRNISQMSGGEKIYSIKRLGIVFFYVDTTKALLP